MGEANPQRGLFYQLSLESFVPAEHPLRAIRPLIDDAAIRRTCRDLYAPIGRPSIPVIRQDLARVAVETFERSVHLQRSAGEPGCRGVSSSAARRTIKRSRYGRRSARLALGFSEDGVRLRRAADVAMMQATDFGNLHDAARVGELDWPDIRRILVEREMRARPVIVGEVAYEDAAEVPFAQD